MGSYIHRRSRAPVIQICTAYSHTHIDPPVQSDHELVVCVGFIKVFEKKKKKAGITSQGSP